MIIRIKLFASLGKYIPNGTAVGPTGNEADMEAADGATISDIIGSLNLPIEFCHLVLVNGYFISPSARGSHVLTEGDDLAIWPPVAGGNVTNEIAGG
ncbi:MAG TPA: MoaD/ThiS family protein [Rhodospirillales bacterium]|jgi:sulfur carrier protein ThiS|nr:MoaD/ThiS family protein [Rhodospirillales bacterium]|tara:strand:- start:259 stop:549 length:291 start_codon:yes stop_codon:yes gene_type:complete